MIEDLYVNGMGGIRSAELSFSGDFIVITGESGAGKSSLVRAFEFISGKRAQVASIHADYDEVSVEAIWDKTCDDGEHLITRRTLLRSGKGRSFIHGTLSTVGQLAEISASLIEIQSQFAQLNLLDPIRQLELIDFCGGDGLKHTKDRLAELFPAMLAAEKDILDLRKKRSELETDLEGAPVRVRQIKALNLYPGCEQEWTDELLSLERQLNEAGRFAELLYRMKGGDMEIDLIDQLDALLRELYAVAADASKERWAELGETALSNLQELFASAKSELNLVPRDELETRYETAETKIGMLRKVKRELGARSADELMAYLGEVSDDMKWLRESAALLEERTSRAAELRNEVGSLARKLRAQRESAAQIFGERVNRHLCDLAMEDNHFSVQILKHDKVRASGAESASFMLSLKDMQPNPVNKVASGGELSRILIAIQASIEPSRLPGTLVFDEVEAGLGGRTALLAGEKLKELSRSCRTILITHEATIAAMADKHFVVRRKGDETQVLEIFGEEREREIARMLSGSESPEAIGHARALLGANRSA